MPESIDIEISGIALRLLAGRGVYWPERQVLFVADTHLGKEATFRRHGIPVPRGSSRGTLASISDMMCHTEASQLVVLGDMFHARSSLSEDVCDSLEDFFSRHAGKRFTLIRGNHDARVKIPSEWPIEVVEPVARLGNLALGHHPSNPPDNSELLLCGHLHPAIQVGSPADSLGPMPCFWLSKRCLVLPAIGEFTGNHTVRLRTNDQAWFIAEGEVIEKVHRRSKAGI